MTHREVRQDGGGFRLNRMIPQRSLRLALYFAFWTFLGTLNSATAMIERLDDPGIGRWEPIVWEMSSIYTTAWLCPLVVLLTRLHPFRRDNWLRLLMVHLGAMALFSLAHSGGMVAIRHLCYGLAGSSYDFGGGNLGLQLLYEFYKDVRLYWIIVFLSLGFEYYNKYREQELEASVLETRLAEAELDNLRQRLDPHFLFNTLHAISSFVQVDPGKADLMIARLSELLRMALRGPNRQEAALEEELSRLRLYVEIMKARFDGEFDYRTQIDPGSLNALVPSLLLQPLVENAFRHGISRRRQGAAIEVASSVRDGVLRLRVRDNGLGSEQPEAVLLGKGLGLSSAAERLRRLYGARHRFHAGNIEGGQADSPFQAGGFEVAMQLPFHVAGTPPERVAP